MERIFSLFPFHSLCLSVHTHSFIFRFPSPDPFLSLSLVSRARLFWFFFCFQERKKYSSAEHQIKVLSAGERPWLLCSLPLLTFACLCSALLRPKTSVRSSALSLSLSLCICQTTHFFFPSCSRNKVSAQCIKQCIVIFFFMPNTHGQHPHMCAFVSHNASLFFFVFLAYFPSRSGSSEHQQEDLDPLPPPRTTEYLSTTTRASLPEETPSK